MTVADGSVFQKILKIVIWEKNIRYYFYSGVTIMKLQLTLEHHFYADKKLFQLFYIENKFAKYFAIFWFKYFVSHIAVIRRNDKFDYTTGKIELSCVP